MNEQIISMVVSNQVGVLARANSIFSRKMLNIMSLTISYEGDHEKPRITILADGKREDADSACKVLSKNEDVHNISLYEPDEVIQREMIVVKLPNNKEVRELLDDIEKNFDYNIIREKENEFIIEYTGSVIEADFFLEKLKDFQEKAVSRASVILVDNK